MEPVKTGWKHIKGYDMRFIGITGGIGAGKSEILKYIREHYKCKIYLADDVAKEVRKPGTECYKKLTELMGEDVIRDAKKMSAALFADSSLLEKVNAIIHPAVKDYLLAELDKAGKDKNTELFFVEAALLIECGYRKLVDEMWYVYADEKVRISRLISARGYSEKKALSIIKTQLSDEEYRRGSDFVIDNSGSLEDSYKAIRDRLKDYDRLK